MNKVKCILKPLAFICIIVLIFVWITYLYRNIGYNRARIIGLDEEKQDVDVVFVGGSSIYTYWEPMNAWKDYGITSYNYACDSLPFELSKYLIKEAEKVNNADLYVVELRNLISWSSEFYEAGLRNPTDAMNVFSMNRIEGINYYFSIRGNDSIIERIPYYFDIMKYHSQEVDILASQENWTYSTNRWYLYTKGFQFYTKYAYVNTPHGITTDKIGELGEEQKKILVDLLEYCKSADLNVLFVLSPFTCTVGQSEIYNAVSSIISEYGYCSINCNYLYNDIGIDFATDFYNGYHVNIYGAEKFTRYMGQFIIDNYNLADHREEDSYNSWNKDYENWLVGEKACKNAIDIIRQDVEYGRAIGSELQNTFDFGKWITLVNDERFTMIIVGKSSSLNAENEIDRRLLNSISTKCSNGDEAIIRAYSNGILLQTATEEMKGTCGVSILTNYTASYFDRRISINVLGKECALEGDFDIVVINNNYGIVVDSITLVKNDKGRIEVVRK